MSPARHGGRCLVSAMVQTIDLPRSHCEPCPSCQGEEVMPFPAKKALFAAAVAAALVAAVPAVHDAVTSTPTAATAGKRVVNYFPQWGVYERKHTVGSLVKNGSAADLTVVNYAFANIHATDLTCFENTQSVGNPTDADYPKDNAGDAWADYQKVYTAAESVDGQADAADAKLRGNFNQLKKLKAKYPNLKVVMSIGGWSFSKHFAKAAATDASRKKLVSSCIKMFIDGNIPSRDDWGTGKPAGGDGTAAGIFDGFDLDWEYPGGGGLEVNSVDPNDKANFTALVKEFRTQLDAKKSGMILSAFTAADPKKIDKGLELDKLHQYFTYFNVQGYDFHGGSWEPNITGNASNINLDPADPSTDKFSVDIANQIYLKAGVPADKILLGLPFYGRGWTGVTTAGDRKGLYQKATGSAKGDFEVEPGVMAYNNVKKICTGDKVVHDEALIATYCYTGTDFWSYDDAWVIGKKLEYAKKLNLGGAYAWNTAEDPEGELNKEMAKINK
ncbi:glycoside hydrolase family 18 protein [Pseudonocardiaceae bacterium YIM PH 21723]|nr:glycoside hydrolase family 18 protein [Pseudonocardiaceae bacterium YIM PH 21723]